MNDDHDNRPHGRGDWSPPAHGAGQETPGQPLAAGSGSGQGHDPEQSGEHTGFWSPSWDEDDDSAAGRAGAGAPPRPSQGPPRSPDGPMRPRQPTAGPRSPVPPGAPRRPGRPGPGGPPQQPVGSPLPAPPPRNLGDMQTEVLPAVSETIPREPELITHREPLPGEPGVVNPEVGRQAAAVPSEEQEKKSRRKKVWRRVRRTCYVLAGLAIIAPIAAFFIAYQYVKVPSPQEVLSQQDKVGLISYADGTEMAKIQPKDAHSLVQYQDIPEQVRQAVYGAEDRSFLKNGGFDFQGIARAIYKNLTGGSGGGSTISQQYIKKASGNDQRTLDRKFFELVKASKMNNEESKQDIITAYLNIVPFGRGAVGIQDAATAYFGKPVKDLNVSEAALLAGVIQSPYKWDPGMSMPDAKRRWNYTLDGMVTTGYLDKATRAKQQFPVTLDRAKGTAQLRNTLNGPRRYIESQVTDELTALGFPQNVINSEGLKVTTTIDPAAQQAAEDAWKAVMQDTQQQDYLKAALVAVDPKTGGVIAYEGGGDGLGTDYADQLQNPGSSFKPFVFAGSLEKGGGLNDVYDGSSPRTFKGRDKPVSNSPGVKCDNPCTVKSAMTNSVNTVFYDMGLNAAGVGTVAAAAHQAGIPNSVRGLPLLVGYDDATNKPVPNSNPDGNISIGGGHTVVRPIDMAYAYSTFANDGMRNLDGKNADAPHFVTKVVDSQNKVQFEYHPQAKQAFDQTDPTKNGDIARNVTESIVGVPAESHLTLSDGRPVAGKTGTQQADGVGVDPSANSQAWMVGYTPQVAAAAWVGRVDSPNQAIKGNYTACDAPGSPCKPNHNIYGRQEPGVMWQKFMDAYLNGKPVEQFAPFHAIGQAADAMAAAAASSRQQAKSTVAPTTTEAPVPTTTEAPVETTTKPTHTRPTITPPVCWLGACNTTTAGTTAPTTAPTSGGQGGHGGGGQPPPTFPTPPGGGGG